MAHSAMSTTILNGEWDPHSYKFEEWLLYNDGLEDKEIHDPTINLTKHEIAEQVLHDIEDLGRNDTKDWLDEFPLFDELETLTPVEEMEMDTQKKFGSHDFKLEQEQVSSTDGSIVPEIQQPPISHDLFSASYENSATFILSPKSILYINNQPYVGLTSLQPLENAKPIKSKEEEIFSKGPNKKGDSGNEKGVEPEFWSHLESPDVKTEMEVVDEIVRNTALEFDSWESDTTRSESSSYVTSASDLSPKRNGEEEEEEEGEGEEVEGVETDDPDWKPDSPKLVGRHCLKRAKPYWRGGSQEEKKLRKKEQNKNAATRYRQKKKAEVDEILKEEKLLKERKSKLEEKAADIQNEIKCIKALMRELFKAKGIIN